MIGLSEVDKKTVVPFAHCLQSLVIVMMLVSWVVIVAVVKYVVELRYGVAMLDETDA